MISLEMRAASLNPRPDFGYPSKFRSDLFDELRLIGRRLPAHGQPAPRPTTEGGVPLDEDPDRTRICMEEAHWAHFKWHLPTLTIGDFRSEAYWIATGEGAELVGAILRQRVRDRLTRFALRERDRKSKIDQLDDTHQNLDVDFLPPPERCRKSGWIYRMPCKQRRVLELIKIDGKDRWEVAAELGVSEATVSRKYTAAMERLKILCKKAA